VIKFHAIGYHGTQDNNLNIDYNLPANNIFLDKLLNIENIDYAFCISKKDKQYFEKYNTNDILNNLAFSPVNYKEKKRIFNMLINQEIKDIKMLNGNIELVFERFRKSYNIKDITIEKYMIYFYEWILILTDKNITLENVKFLKKNITTNNYLFWYHLVKVFYNNSKFKETLYLVKYVKKEYIKKDNYLYNDLILYQLISLKDDKKYLRDANIQKKICKLSKQLKGFEYIQVLTLLEYAFLQHNIVDFKQLVYTYKKEILNWNIYQVLNVYELSVYLQDKEIINEISSMLNFKDIGSYNGSEEYDIYQFLNAIVQDDKHKIQFLYDRLRNNFDFSHYVLFEGR